MMRVSRRQPGFIAAILHRLSGLALAIFLPVHFLTLATALRGADALDAFLAVAAHPAVKASELALIIAMAVHLTLGLRVLAIEFLDFREKTLAALSACCAIALCVGLAFLISAG
ncbi:MAG: succinate dehydrogenase [Proteobacteria bacterium]|nr:succinate dehydrogenase [Pseudomonadota bacterium]